MSKPFFEVFPTLKAGEDIRNMFEGAQVLKVTTNSDRTFLRVYIVSRHLIQKTLVYEMEHLIKNQLFGRSAVQVEIREKYELSGQYTPENVMAEYLDSFLAERTLCSSPILPGLIRILSAPFSIAAIASL